MKFRSENKIKIEGGMSSMTDLVFLLLIFFIVISTMISAGVNIDVPKKGGAISNSEILKVNINDKNEYFINDNNNQYKEYREAALLSYETGEDQLGYTYSELITLKDHYKRNREISYFSFVGVYILNIIDASVNAHLFHFDVSDDISLNIRPYSTFSNTGVSFSLNL